MVAVRDESFGMRELRPDDTALLARATLGNVNWSGQRFTMEHVASTPELAHYFTDWPADREFGIVAETTAETSPIGVAWARFFDAHEPGYGFVNERTPEMSVWVASENRGNGLGTALIVQVLEQTRVRGYSAISLSVEDGNPARRLYEYFGFITAQGAAPGTLILHL